MSFFTWLLIFCGSCSKLQSDEPYDYPVKPGSEAWEKLHSMEEKKIACRVPPRRMKKMTTEALVDTIMEYPFITEVNSYITGMGLNESYEGKIKEAFYLLSDDFQGVEILKIRRDAIENVEKYILENDLKEGDGLYFVAKKIIEYIRIWES